MSSFKILALIGAVAAVGCNGKKETEQPKNTGDNSGGTGDTAGTGDTGGTKAAPADPAAVFGPLEKGADYKSWTKVNKEPVLSKTHGGRFVDTYVNAAGLEAYKNEDADIPIGTVIVKSSWEAKDGKPSEVAGPLFVMARVDDNGEPGWWYALHWEKVPEAWQSKVGAAQVYWRTPSAKAGYCSECHDNYPRELGGVPKDKRNY